MSFQYDSFSLLDALLFYVAILSSLHRYFLSQFASVVRVTYSFSLSHAVKIQVVCPFNMLLLCMLNPSSSMLPSYQVSSGIFFRNLLLLFALLILFHCPMLSIFRSYVLSI